MSETTEATGTKVVINSCYGGFNLSDDAKREYLRRTGQTWREEPSQFASMGPHFYVGDHLWSSYDLERTDPMLVAIVEEWGGRANGSHAALVVESVPAGTQYRVDEYDGYEHIETRDGIDWATA